MRIKIQELIAGGRRRSGKFALVIFSVLVGLLLGEVGLRTTGITFPVFNSWDYDRAMILKPGKKGWYQGEGNAYLQINSLGYRDVEHEAEKPAGTYRIAVLGDSFAEARQVDIQDTFWKRLEYSSKMINALPEHNLEVLNFGIGGYGTTQEFLTLRKDVLRFSPDLVILAFFAGNDLINNSQELSYKTKDTFRPFHRLRGDELIIDNSFREPNFQFFKHRFLLSSIHYLRILELLNQARRHYYLRNMGVRTVKKQSVGSDELEIGLYNQVYLAPKHQQWRDAWKVTKSLLEKIYREVSAIGARFVVVTITTAAQVHPNRTKRQEFARRLGTDDLLYPERRLSHHAEQVGYSVIPLAAILQKRTEGTDLYLHGFANALVGAGHWNEIGHELAAEVIVSELIARNLLR